MLIAKAFELGKIIPELHKKIFGESFPHDEYLDAENPPYRVGNFYIFQEGDVPIGYAIVFDENCAKNLHVWHAGLLQDYQGKGYMAQLLDHLVNVALNVQYDSLTLETTNLRPNLIRLVVNYGFDIVGVKQQEVFGQENLIYFKYKVHPPIEWEIDMHAEGKEMTFGSLEKTLVEAHKANCTKVVLVNANASNEEDLALIKYAIRLCKGFAHPIEISVSFSQF